ncbi:MAG: hypothetical protein AVDCRST_MAG49-270, partial [uncultured Thermomicrobiales bacterium]
DLTGRHRPHRARPADHRPGAPTRLGRGPRRGRPPSVAAVAAPLGGRHGLARPPLRALAATRGLGATPGAPGARTGHLRRRRLGGDRPVPDGRLRPARRGPSSRGGRVPRAQRPHLRDVPRPAGGVLLQPRRGQPARGGRRAGDLPAPLLPGTDGGGDRTRRRRVLQHADRPPDRPRGPRRPVPRDRAAASGRSGRPGPLPHRALLPVCGPGARAGAADRRPPPTLAPPAGRGRVRRQWRRRRPRDRPAAGPTRPPPRGAAGRRRLAAGARRV